MMLAVDMEYFWHLELNSGRLDGPIGATYNPPNFWTSTMIFSLWLEELLSESYLDNKKREERGRKARRSEWCEVESYDEEV